MTTDRTVYRSPLTATSPYRVYIGFSPDEIIATCVAEASLRGRAFGRCDIRRISRLSLYQHYHRPTEVRRDGRLWDVISNAPMSTDHAIARFFIPWLCDYQGWALFTDGDVIFRRTVTDLFKLTNERYAVMCVQHPELPATGLKKDGDIQQPYPRKNWSSVMLINCGHPANRALDLDRLNSVPGRDLHAFNWLRDDEIGALPPEWNYLVNVNPMMVDPAIVHFTEGVPLLDAHAHDPFAAEWFYWARTAGWKHLSQPDVAQPAAATSSPSQSLSA